MDVRVIWEKNAGGLIGRRIIGSVVSRRRGILNTVGSKKDIDERRFEEEYRRRIQMRILEKSVQDAEGLAPIISSWRYRDY